MPSAAMPCLPPGFRFHPTDEELIVHYLTRQAASMACPAPIVAEVNIYKCNPWDLPAKALFGENEWYFFSPRDRKYPNGARPNRAAGSGYWKATGTDKAILSTPTSDSIGVKKALVFYRGKPPKGVKTGWIMHEYRLTAGNRSTKRRGSSMRLDDWVLCRIHKKCSNLQQFSSCDQEQEEGSSTVEDSHNNNNMNSSNNNTSSSPKSEAFDGDDDQLQFRPMVAITKSCSLTDLLNTVDYAALSQLLLGGGSSSDDAPPVDQPPPPQQSPLVYAPPPWQTLNYNNNYNHIVDMPQLAEASLDERDYANDNNNYNGLKRKRSSLEDGFDFAKKSPQLLPSDSRSSSSYCNQVQLADQTSTSSFQNSGMLIHPFLNQHLLLNNHHLQM